MVDAILACLSIPKVCTSSLGYLLQKHIFAFFLISLAQFLANHLAPIVIIVHALIVHAGTPCGSSTTAISLLRALLLHF